MRARRASSTLLQPSPEFLAAINHDFARRHLILSEGCGDTVEYLVVSAGTRPAAIFNTGVRLGRATLTRVIPDEHIAAAVDRAYAAVGDNGRDMAGGAVLEGSGDVETDLRRAVRETDGDLLHTQGKSSVVRLVDLLLFEALGRGASDVHVQPVRDRTLIRYRLDGALHTVRELPASVAISVVSRIKVMANLDVAERRAPQDGRATVTIGRSGGERAGRGIDLRISILPSTYGERVVIRLLDPARSPHLLSFAGLGMPPDIERAYKAQAARSSGIVLSTGPTGSGKTTTLYATLAWLGATNGGQGPMRADDVAHGQDGAPVLRPARPTASTGCELNMMTVEDPVEYDLSASGGRGAVSQTQVDPKKSVTFATGLRHILRQDPDVIMVGEIRDEETARIAVQASLTGHMVLSTLHTNDAASAIARLLDLSVEPFLVSSSLAAVLAQRLVRTLHPLCDGRGCEACMRTGFKGRTGLFELLVVGHTIRDLINRRCSSPDLKAAARRAGMTTIREAGAMLVRARATTETEVARVIDVAEETEA
ncbi:MAG: type II/IV secretion system protein [Phycisphaerae bacterium]|nr:type II/IV secretion system protein [Phycisphaerae bacterium]